MVKTRVPDLGGLEIPMDTWTRPFWEAASREELRLPRCASCGTFRWPPGPFCPACSSQDLDWVEAGPARLYSFTIVHRGADDHGEPIAIAPGLVEFAEAGGLRIMAAIVDSEAEELCVDAPLTLAWRKAGEARVPVFKLA